MGSKLNGWAWSKRWDNRTYIRHVGARTGKIYTLKKK